MGPREPRRGHCLLQRLWSLIGSSELTSLGSGKEQLELKEMGGKEWRRESREGTGEEDGEDRGWGGGQKKDGEG